MRLRSPQQLPRKPQDALSVCSNRLLDVLSEGEYEPMGLGRKTEVPPAVFLPLFDLGVHHLRQIVQRKGTQAFIVPFSHLQTQIELQGLTAKVNRAHRIAPNSHASDHLGRKQVLLKPCQVWKGRRSACAKQVDQ